MKKIFKKNQIMITALAVMIAVAGYLNYSGRFFGDDSKDDKKDKKEDMKSTAYTFTIVGFLGMVFLILFELDLLPFQVSTYMKVMMGVVMGAMFLIFFIIGIRYFKALKQADSDADEEENTYNTVMNWFREHHPADLINDRVDMTESDEQLYFARYEIMSHLISEKFPDLDETFLDHMVETLYNEYYS